MVVRSPGKCRTLKYGPDLIQDHWKGARAHLGTGGSIWLYDRCPVSHPKSSQKIQWTLIRPRANPPPIYIYIYLHTHIVLHTVTRIVHRVLIYEVM